MKKLVLVICTLCSIALFSCDGEIIDPKTPRLTVECTPEVNGPNDVSNCTVELHTTPQFNSPVLTTASSGSTDFASGIFENLNPNTYYCQVWKDNNSNDTMDLGDFYGFWPQEIVISDTTDLTISIVIRSHN